MTKEQIKELALTELHQSQELKDKIDGILFRNHIHRETHILDDVFQETFYHLWKKTPDEISEMYLDNPRRLFGLAVKIAIWKGVSKRKNNPKKKIPPVPKDWVEFQVAVDESSETELEYPKHSLSRFILFGSNYQSKKYLSPTETFENEGEGNSFPTIVDDKTEERNEWVDVMKLVRSQLDPDNLKFMEEYLSTNKRGRTPEYRMKYQQMCDAIKTIVTNEGIKRIEL